MSQPDPIMEVPPSPAPVAEPSHLRRLFFGRRAGELIVLVAVWVLFYLFVVRGMSFFLVPSRSMEPNLLVGDQLVTLSQRTYERGDIVVLHDPKEKGAHIVKRIVGLAGDHVGVGGGALFINGGYVSEPYIAEPMKYAIVPEVVVPEGHIFFLGDNRNDSDDSHIDGTTVPVSEIVGKVRCIYYPYSRTGWVRSHPVIPVRDET